MTTAEFLEVAEVDKIPAGCGSAFVVNGAEIALFKVDGEIYAISDTCLHQGSSLSAGELDGKIVKCRKHGWCFDVTTGFVTHVPDYGVKSYPVRVVDGKALIGVEDSPA